MSDKRIYGEGTCELASCCKPFVITRAFNKGEKPRFCSRECAARQAAINRTGTKQPQKYPKTAGRGRLARGWSV